LKKEEESGQFLKPAPKTGTDDSHKKGENHPTLVIWGKE